MPPTSRHRLTQIAFLFSSALLFGGDAAFAHPQVIRRGLLGPSYNNYRSPTHYCYEAIHDNVGLAGLSLPAIIIRSVGNGYVESIGACNMLKGLATAMHSYITNLYLELQNGFAKEGITQGKSMGIAIDFNTTRLCDTRKIGNVKFELVYSQLPARPGCLSDCYSARSLAPPLCCLGCCYLTTQR